MRSTVKAGRFLIPLGFLLSLFPFMNSAVGLLLGISLSLVVGNPYLEKTRKLQKKIMFAAITGLGAGVSLPVVLKAGGSGIMFTLLSLAATLGAGHVLGKLFRTSREMTALLSAGTAICGASAIAAVSPVIRAKDETISLSLAVIFLLNAVALLIFPTLGEWTGLTQDQFGWWAGIAIHDTSSVVGASMAFGERALEVGTTVKLARALWIIPLAILYAKLFHQKESSEPKQYPWFIGGFVFMSALVTFIPELTEMGIKLEWVSKRAMVGAIFLIGSNITLKAFKALGLKPLLHGLCLWFFISVLSLLSVKYA